MLCKWEGSEEDTRGGWETVAFVLVLEEERVALFEGQRKGTSCRMLTQGRKGPSYIIVEGKIET